VSRLLTAVYDPAERLGAAARGKLPGGAGREVASGPLRLSYTGSAGDHGDIVCLLDGFLDNLDELAAELDADLVAPSPQRTAGAVLARGYRRWGPDLPARMRGDFVLLIWDRKRRAGIIARDQLGVRPAYIHRVGGILRFSTELQALLDLMPRRPEPDGASVAHWIAASSRPGTQTLYRGVHRLGPGEMVLMGGAGSRLVRYWQPRYEEPLDLPAPEFAERVRESLRVAVGRRLARGAPSAVLLSGGLDSSAVAAIAVELGEGRVRACSATFPDHPVADEAELIAELRAKLGLRGPVAEVRAGGLLDSAVEHLAAWGVPLLGWGDFWTLPLMQAAAREGVAQVLGGDGGDELFGPRQNLIADTIRAGRPLRALGLTRDLPGAGPHVPRRQVASLVASQLATALPRRPQRRLEGWLEMRRQPSWLLAGARRDLAESDDLLAWKRLPGPLWWAEVADGVANGLDRAGVFEHQRRRAAFAGLEARHPLLDLDLVSLCLRQPPAATLEPRFNRPILRESVAGLVPESVRLRPVKARFESLVADCLSGADMPAVRTLLLDPGAEIRAFADQERMQRQLFEGNGGVAYGSFRWMWLVWRLLTAELWLRFERAPYEKQAHLTVSEGPKVAIA
jgi:asparagine synthase (glutamine-hydrolysing)